MPACLFTVLRRHLSSSAASTLLTTKGRLLVPAPATATTATTTATFYSTSPVANTEQRNPKDRWVRLPPCDICPSSSVGNIMAMPLEEADRLPITTTITVIKWIRRCCPGLPVTLLHKLFRLRKIRKHQLPSITTHCGQTSQDQHPSFGRVSANDEINYGDVILLPNSVRQHPPPADKAHYCCNSDEIDYIRTLELYKDTAIIVLNKPHGLAVQGGIGIKLSMDVLAATSLRYDYKEPPRLVHRLDKDSSGILVLGRTQTSAAILHSIFREKTFEASKGINEDQRFLQRRYWALVIGKPRYSKGKISEPLKMVVKNGKYERIAISSPDSPSSQVAITEYKVIGSHQHGCTWLELCPMTGRKHQLRVHCAEVLGTPILGDYKYGWNAHKRWVSVLPNSSPDAIDDKKPFSSNKLLPFGLNLVGGDILDGRPWLHLHCRQMKLPNISEIIQDLQSSNDDPKQDFSKIEYLDLVAPLPCHMQTSWDLLNQSSINA